MHSYISNSNSRIPKNNYIWFWVIFSSLLISALILSEIYWRKAGFMPNITDTMSYWAANRKKVYFKGNNNKKLVIIGASRSQLGIVPEVIENELKLKTVHLAIDGTHSLYVLKDLSEDSSFDGIILFSMTAASLNPNYFEEAKPWVDFYHTNYDKLIDFSSKYDSFLQVKLQQRFVLMSSALNFKRIIYSTLSPKPLYLHMQPSRYRPAYYHKRMTKEELLKLRSKLIALRSQPNRKISMSEEIYKDILINKFKKYYDNLKKHNASLIIVRMPTTDEYWSMDESVYSKDKYWDKINTLTGIPTIHFKDYNQLSSFDCPDTSHLDAKDSPLFTRRLSKIILKSMDMAL